jgi:DNA-binding NtrC family response regulator
MDNPQTKRRIALIVEDDADLRALMVALLDEVQVETVECESAEAALAIMLLRGQEIAIILSDIRLPGAMDGIDFAHEATMRWPHLPFVLTSGNAGERLKHLPPGTIYMPKPWQTQDILKIAEQAQLSSDKRTSFGR